MGILELESYLSACILPEELVLPLKAAAKNMLWCIFHPELSILINYVCAVETLNQRQGFCSSFYHRLSVCPWRSNWSSCASCAKQRRDLFPHSQHGRKLCAPWDRSHHIESSFSLPVSLSQCPALDCLGFHEERTMQGKLQDQDRRLWACRSRGFIWTDSSECHTHLCRLFQSSRKCSFTYMPKQATIGLLQQISVSSRLS